jgi:hypothetical protein
MTEYNNITHLLSAFCQKNNLTRNKADENQIYQFYIDGHKILCFQQREYLVIEGVLGDLPKAGSESDLILEKLLQLSLLNSDAFGFVVSLDENEKLTLSNKQAIENYSLSQLEETLDELLFQIESYERIFQETNYLSPNLSFGVMPLS